MKKIGLLLFILLLTGCVFDPFTNKKYGEEVINTWFSYQEEDMDLGKVRRNVFGIYEIKDVSCKFYEKYKSNYIFDCLVLYTKNSDTVIPFASSEKLNFYALFTPKKDKTYTYKVYDYNSKGIWESDKTL